MPENLPTVENFAPASEDMNRLYVVESTPTITGSMAEHRLPLRSGEIEGLARRIAHDIDAQFPAPQAARVDAQENGSPQSLPISASIAVRASLSRANGSHRLFMRWRIS